MSVAHKLIFMFINIFMQMNRYIHILILEYHILSIMVINQQIQKTFCTISHLKCLITKKNIEVCYMFGPDHNTPISAYLFPAHCFTDFLLKPGFSWFLPGPRSAFPALGLVSILPMNWFTSVPYPGFLFLPFLTIPSVVNKKCWDWKVSRTKGPHHAVGIRKCGARWPWGRRCSAAAGFLTMQHFGPQVLTGERNCAGPTSVPMCSVPMANR